MAQGIYRSRHISIEHTLNDQSKFILDEVFQLDVLDLQFSLVLGGDILFYPTLEKPLFLADFAVSKSFDSYVGTLGIRNRLNQSTTIYAVFSQQW